MNFVSLILKKTIQGYSDLEDELKDMRDLLNDDAFLDKNGGITDEGLAQIALLSQSLGNAKKTIADYTTGLQKLKELYENGIISLDEYNDKSAEYRKGIREATSDVKSYQDSLTSLYTDALKAEVDALDKIIDKRKKAYDQQRKYTEYQKKVNSQQKNIDSIKAQIEAMKNSSDAATQARVKKLRQDLTDAEDELNSTKQDHRDEMISDGFSKISDDMADMLENVEYDISHSADKIYEIFHDMFGKVCADSEATYNKINSIITNTGFVGSTDFNNNQSQLGSSEGVKNQVSNASQSQTEANKNPSSSASGTITSPIKDNKAENDRITNDIMKPEDTTNRSIYNWISKKLEKHDTEEFVRYIHNQRMYQKYELNKKCKYTFGNNAHVILLKNKIKNGKLANYLLIDDSLRRYGNYGSLVAYLKSQKVKETV